jgi:hypothetical protein
VLGKSNLRRNLFNYTESLPGVYFYVGLRVSTLPLLFEQNPKSRSLSDPSKNSTNRRIRKGEVQKNLLTFYHESDAGLHGFRQGEVSSHASDGAIVILPRRRKSDSRYDI